MKTLSMPSFAGTSLLLILLLFAACATGPDISSQSNPQIDLSEFETYSILTPSRFVEGGNPGAAIKYAPLVKEAIRTSLNGKGYREVDPESADFAVIAKATIVPKTVVTDTGFDYSMIPGPGPYGYWGSRYPYGYMNGGVDVTTYDEGTLIIEVFDSDSREMAWVGWATDRVRNNVDPAIIEEVIAEILLPFPPGT